VFKIIAAASWSIVVRDTVFDRRVTFMIPILIRQISGIGYVVQPAPTQ